MGGSGTQTTQQSSGVPKWLQPFFKTAEQDYLSGTAGLPGFGNLYANFPQMQTPNLTATQLADITGFQDMSGGPNAPEIQSQKLLTELADPNSAGYTAATTAAQNQFKDLTLPTIENQAASMGQGNSGAALEATAKGEEQALVPLLQQQEQTQLGAAGQLGSLGGQEFGQQVTQLTNALQAAGLPYQVAVQQAQDIFNRQSGQSQLAYGLETLPLSQLGSVFGRGTSVSTSTAPKF